MGATESVGEVENTRDVGEEFLRAIAKKQAVDVEDVAEGNQQHCPSLHKEAVTTQRQEDKTSAFKYYIKI